MTDNRFNVNRVRLLHLLLLVGVAEFSLYRLAAPALKPDQDIPLWHTVLEGVGLFAGYFAALLAIAVIGQMVWEMMTAKRPYHVVARWALSAAAILTAVVAAYMMIMTAGGATSMLLRVLFLALLATLFGAVVTARGDLRAKIGLLLIFMPLILSSSPFIGTLISGEEIRYSGFEPQMVEAAFAATVVAGIALPFCFAPRPMMVSMTRTAPITIAMVVSLMGALILRQHFEVGWRLAKRGLALDLGPGISSNMLALAVVALGAVAWTLAMCFAARSEARGDIGIGIGLVLMGVLVMGASYPGRYLLSTAGLLVIAEAATRVPNEEHGNARAGRVGSPPIATETWQRYVRALLARLRVDPEPGPEESAPSAVTVRTDEQLNTTHVVAERSGVQVRVCVEQSDGAIAGIDVLCGDVIRDTARAGAPAWTLYARPERLLGLHAHPEPPPCPQPNHKSGDEAFDRRFTVRGTAEQTAALLDEALRARMTALLDGWLAYWPERGLLYRVYPGLGAPLDHPVPITDLAFGGADSEPNVERLILIIDLLAELGARVLPLATPEPDPTEGEG